MQEEKREEEKLETIVTGEQWYGTSKRGEGESFADYKQRQKHSKKVLDRYKKGTMVFASVALVPKQDENGEKSDKFMRVTRQYIKKIHGDLNEALFNAKQRFVDSLKTKNEMMEQEINDNNPVHPKSIVEGIRDLAKAEALEQELDETMQVEATKVEEAAERHQKAIQDFDNLTDSMLNTEKQNDPE